MQNLLSQGPLSKRPKMGFQDHLLLNAVQKYCRMLQGEHSAILSTCIKLPHGFKTFVLSIFELPLKTGFTIPSFENSVDPEQLFSFRRRIYINNEYAPFDSVR